MDGSRDRISQYENCPFFIATENGMRAAPWKDGQAGHPGVTEQPTAFIAGPELTKSIPC